MSFQAMAWAVKQKLPAKEKLTLLMLANYASNEAGDCYPSISTLVEDTGLSKDSVIRAIKALEDAGLVAINRRQMDGVNLPNSYRLNLRGVVAVCDQGSRSQQGGVVAVCDSNLSVEPVSEPKQLSAPTAPRSTPPMKIAAADPATGQHFLFGLNSGLEWQLAQDDYDEMRRLYPAVDVAAELRKARGWLIGNPTKRKTERGILRFLHTWLARAQDRGGNTHAAVQGRSGMSVADRVRARADANDRARGADFDQHWFGRTIEHEA